MTIAIDKYRLPSPVLARELDYEALRSQAMAQLREIWSQSEVLQEIAPDFDAWMVETPLESVMVRLAAFRDLLFTAEMNDWARVVTLAHFAAGSDLDVHAGREGLTRFDGESDTLLLERIILERKAKNAYGTDPWYMRHARNADARVREVAVTGNGRRRVEIAVLSNDNDGVPADDLLVKLQDRLGTAPVTRSNDIVTVVPAILTTTTIAADVWLDDGAPSSVLDGLADALKSAWNGGTRLGRDLTRSWCVAQIHVAGVQRVEVHLEDIAVAPNRGIAIGDVILTVKGRAW